MRKTVVRVVTLLGGLFFVLEFMLPAELRRPGADGPYFTNPLSPWLNLATDLVIVLGTMAFLLGPINLVRSHFGNLVRWRRGAVESAVFLLFLVLGLGLAGVKEFPDLKGAFGLEGASDAFQSAYNLLFYGLMSAFGATSMALLAFYLVSAAYRSFRFQSLEAGVMMITALVVLLGLVPLGTFLTSWLPTELQLPTWAAWVFAVPNSAVQRAVVIGTFAGAFAAGLRLWLGVGQKTE